MASLQNSLSRQASQSLNRERLQRAVAKSAAANDYRTNIVAFVRDILHADPAPYQIDILEHFVGNHRAAVRAPHGAGKTALSAWVILWGVAVFDDVKVVTTAGAWRQLIYFTWPEVRKWAAQADWGKLGLSMRYGKELLELSIKRGNAQAFAAASNQPALIEGAHAKCVIYIFDEAKAIPAGTWDAAEGAFSTGEAYALAISTPGETSGRFYDIHQRKPGYRDWWVRHITLQEAIESGRINPDWAKARAEQWGESSAVYQNRVLGEFADSGEDSVIPLRWIELANERWRECEGRGEGKIAYGIDPAYKGEDKTAIARLVGLVCEGIDSYAKQDTMQTAGRVGNLIDKQTPVAIDIIGVGAGVYDRLRELGYSAISVNVAQKAEVTDASGQNKFINLRSALWWMIRDALDPNGEIQLAIPPDDALTGDLTAPTWTYTSDSKIVVESKPDIRERIGRSPDKADALALALYARSYGGQIVAFVGKTTKAKKAEDEEAELKKAEADYYRRMMRDED